MNEEEFLFEGLNIILLAYYYLKYKKKKKRTRRWAVRPANRDRVKDGFFAKVYKKIKADDPQLFFRHTRMEPTTYNLLFNLTKKRLVVERGRISAEERLALTISYLAHGVPVPYLATRYKLGRSTARKIILNVCELLWQTLAPIYVSEPTESQYRDIADDFTELWNLPNCCGAIDGQHFPIKCPNRRSFSMVLMAVCDARYAFTNISVGSYGSESNGGIFSSCNFGKQLQKGILPLPQDKPLPNAKDLTPFPHYFVGDAALPLLKNLMRPYPGENLPANKQIFNDRLSRARSTIENSFGVLTTRWRVLRKAMAWSPVNAERVILACIALHNFIISNDHTRWYCSDRYVDWESADHVLHEGEWHSEQGNSTGNVRLARITAPRPATEAFNLRDRLAEYVMKEGALPFQLQKLN